MPTGNTRCFGLSPEARCQQESANHNHRNLNRKGRSIGIMQMPITSNADSYTSRRKGVAILYSTTKTLLTTRRLAPFVREQALGEVLRGNEDAFMKKRQYGPRRAERRTQKPPGDLGIISGDRHVKSVVCVCQTGDAVDTIEVECKGSRPSPRPM